MTRRIGFLFSSNLSIHQSHRGNVHVPFPDSWRQCCSRWSPWSQESCNHLSLSHFRRPLGLCIFMDEVLVLLFSLEQSIMAHHQEQTQPGKAQPCSTDRWDSHRPTTYLGTGEAALPSSGLFPLSPPHSSAPIRTRAPTRIHLQIPSYPPTPEYLVPPPSLIPGPKQLSNPGWWVGIRGKKSASSTGLCYPRSS